MDENEMVKDLTNILRKHCNNTPDEYCAIGDCHECNAKSVINAGYSKVADDEIIITKKEYEQLKKHNRDRKRLRLKWQQAKQGTREILQAINKYLVGTRGIYTIKTFRNCRFEDLMLVRADDLETLVNKLAKEHGVELEE